jgi:hypothetical protein
MKTNEIGVCGRDTYPSLKLKPAKSFLEPGMLGIIPVL